LRPSALQNITELHTKKGNRHRCVVPSSRCRRFLRPTAAPERAAFSESLATKAQNNLRYRWLMAPVGPIISYL